MSITHRQCVAAALLCCFAGLASAAEDDKISTDRPDFLTSPDVVGKGRFQVEFGALVQREDAGDTRTRTVMTPTLLRLGLTDSLELLLETDGRVRKRETDRAAQTTTYTRGYADASVGVKWNSQKGDAGSRTPAIGWVFKAELPSGSRAIRGHGVRPSVLGLAALELGDDVEVTVNAGLKYDSDDAQRRFVAGALGVGVSKELTDRVAIIGEIAGQQLASKRHGGSVVTADLAVTYLLTNMVQVDAMVGRGLTSESPRYLFTTGISARF